MDQLERLRQYRATEHWPFVIGRAVALLLEPAGATTAACAAGPQALRYKLSHPPHVGTPGTGSHGGNSTPARTLVAGAGKSPVFGPVRGE